LPFWLDPHRTEVERNAVRPSPGASPPGARAFGRGVRSLLSDHRRTDEGVRADDLPFSRVVSAECAGRGLEGGIGSRSRAAILF